MRIIKKCSYGDKNQKECGSSFNGSPNHEMYLQQVQNEHFPSLMIGDGMKTILKVHHGIETNKCMLMYTHSKNCFSKIWKN